MKIALYYTHDAKPEFLTNVVFARLMEQCTRLNVKLIAVTRRGRSSADVDLLLEPVGKLDIYERILTGLAECSLSDYVYLCEDDVLYHDCYFENYHHHDRLNYNVNLIYHTEFGLSLGNANRNNCALSQLSAGCECMRTACNNKLKEIEAGTHVCFEPANGIYNSFAWRSTSANIDIRNEHNHTWKATDDMIILDNEPGWGTFENVTALIQPQLSGI